MREYGDQICLKLVDTFISIPALKIAQVASQTPLWLSAVRAWMQIGTSLTRIGLNMACTATVARHQSTTVTYNLAPKKRSNHKLPANN